MVHVTVQQCCTRRALAHRPAPDGTRCAGKWPAGPKVQKTTRGVHRKVLHPETIGLYTPFAVYMRPVHTVLLCTLAGAGAFVGESSRLAMADPHDGPSDELGEGSSLSGGRSSVLPLAGAPQGARLTHNMGAPIGTTSENQVAYSCTLGYRGVPRHARGLP